MEGTAATANKFQLKKVLHMHGGLICYTYSAEGGILESYGSIIIMTAFHNTSKRMNNIY